MPKLKHLRQLFARRRPPITIDINADHGCGNGYVQRGDAEALQLLSRAASPNDAPNHRHHQHHQQHHHANGEALSQSASEDESNDPLRSLSSLLSGYLAGDARRSKRAIVLLEQLPKLLAPLNAVQQQQLRLASSLEEGLQQFRQRDRTMHETLVRLHETCRQQTDVLGLSQQQFDVNRTHVEQLSKTLHDFRASIDALAHSNVQSAQVVERTMKEAVQQQKQIASGVDSTRRWLLMCVIITAAASFATLGTVVVLLASGA